MNDHYHYDLEKIVSRFQLYLTELKEKCERKLY